MTSKIILPENSGIVKPYESPSEELPGKKPGLVVIGETGRKKKTPPPPPPDKYASVRKKLGLGTLTAEECILVDQPFFRSLKEHERDLLRRDLETAEADERIKAEVGLILARQQQGAKKKKQAEKQKVKAARKRGRK